MKWNEMKYERTKALKMIPQIDYKVAIKTSFKLLLFQIYKKNENFAVCMWLQRLLLSPSQVCSKWSV
jgi:hypothetical protein